MPRELVERAWLQGFEAGARLLPPSSNPHKVGGDLHQAWSDGWCQGSDPDLEEPERSRTSA